MLKEKSSIPIAAGEAYSGKFEYNNLIENKSLDILQFDCTHSGGIEFCQHLSKKCSDKNIENAVHIWGSAVAVSANINLSLSLENISFVEIPIIMIAQIRNILFDICSIFNNEILNLLLFFYFFISSKFLCDPIIGNSYFDVY